MSTPPPASRQEEELRAVLDGIGTRLVVVDDPAKPIQVVVYRADRTVPVVTTALAPGRALALAAALLEAVLHRLPPTDTPPPPAPRRPLRTPRIPRPSPDRS